MAAIDDRRGVRVPPELHGVQPRPLEEYARARILQFAQAFAARLNPTVSPAVVQQAALDCLQTLPPADYSGVALEQRDLQLVFRHDCLSLGCLDAQCVLCEHNPHRRCSVNFSPKYLVNDVLKAKCDAPIRVELIDRATGQPIQEDLPDVVLEMCVLDGNAYDQKVVEAGEEREEDLEACALLLNNKAQALLQAGPGATHNANSKVQMSLSKGVAVLPDLHVSDSSEAMLSGRKPPFRLLVKAVHLRGQPISIRHAVSEGFVVATRRTRTAGKVEIPNVDDHISKLEHMGKETVKKLQDIRGSAVSAGMDINVPTNTINKVGEFRKLALLAEADGHLRQKLQQVLKLSKEKWEEARDHAMRAVVADNRMRIWYADKTNMEVGLLFTCRLGDVDLDRPVGLLTKKAQEGAQTTMEATLMAQQTPAQRDQVRILQPQAVASWWQQGHPGWAIYPVDSEHFLATGALDSATLPMPNDPGMMPVGAGLHPPSPSAAAAAAAALAAQSPTPPLSSAAAAAAFNPALASAFMGAAGGLPNDALLRAMSPFMHAGQVPGALANPFMLAGVPTPLGPAPPTSLLAAATGRDGSPRGMPNPTSAFATAAAQSGGGSGGLPANGSGGSGGGAGPTPFAAANNHLMPPPPPVSRSPAMEGGGGGGGAAGGGAAAGGGGAGGAAGVVGSAPLASLANLSGLFGGDMMSRLPQLAGQLNLANFPSLTPGMMSGDLEQLLAQNSLLPPDGGGGSGGAAGLFGGGGRAPSFNIGKLESFNLPDEALAAAMLQMERAAGGGASSQQQQQKQAGPPPPAAAAGQRGTQPAAAAEGAAVQGREGGGEGQQNGMPVAADGAGAARQPADSAQEANAGDGGGRGKGSQAPDPAGPADLADAAPGDAMEVGGTELGARPAQLTPAKRKAAVA